MDVHPTKNGIFIGIDPYPYTARSSDGEVHTNSGIIQVGSEVPA